MWLNLHSFATAGVSLFSCFVLGLIIVSTRSQFLPEQKLTPTHRHLAESTNSNSPAALTIEDLDSISYIAETFVKQKTKTEGLCDSFNEPRNTYDLILNPSNPIRSFINNEITPHILSPSNVSLLREPLWIVQATCFYPESLGNVLSNYFEIRACAWSSGLHYIGMNVSRLFNNALDPHSHGHLHHPPHLHSHQHPHTHTHGTLRHPNIHPPQTIKHAPNTTSAVTRMPAYLEAFYASAFIQSLPILVINPKPAASTAEAMERLKKNCGCGGSCHEWPYGVIHREMNGK